MKLARKLLAVLLAMALCPLMCAGAEEALPEVSEAAPAETPADIPETEATPEAETPSADVPQTDIPETEAPDADIPQTDNPGADIPETEASDDDAPEAETPGADIPETETPDADIPQTDIPGVDIPETEAPDAGIPNTPATEAPTAEPTATPDPFASAKIKVERVGGGELHIGDELTLEARVTGVNVKFGLIWVACAGDAVPVNGKLPWVALRPEVKGERCSIMLTEENVKLRYAARIVGTDIYGIYELPRVLPAAIEETEAPAEAPEAVHPLPELNQPLFSVTEGGIMPNDEDKPDAVHPLPELDHPLFNVTEDGIVPAPEDDVRPDDKPAQPDDKPAEKPVVPEPTSHADDEGLPQYEYERDSDGELVLDGRGNPQPFVPEGVARPAGWARDEDGKLLLDEDGDPIPLFADYERDENGELVLDERGDPIPVVPDGADIPVAYERDEYGKLLLDADGNPIAVQFMPPSSQSVRTLEDLLDPNRSIEIFADWGGTLHYGDELTLTAVLHGYDNAVYSLQWQRSADDATWEDIPGETALTYAFTVTESNAADFWRVSVTITDAVPVEGEI